MKILRLLLLTVVPLFAAGCANSTAPAEQPVAEDPDARLIPLAVGGCAKITLEENMTTGYRWTAKYDAKLCKVEIDHRGPENQGGVPLCGAPGKAIVTVTLLTNATAEVVLEYLRPWEKNTPPVKTVRCKLVSKANTAVF
jgi:predicted secreted protein